MDHEKLAPLDNSVDSGEVGASKAQHQLCQVHVVLWKRCHSNIDLLHIRFLQPVKISLHGLGGDLR